MSTEGPLSRLMSLLGMADKLKPIPEVKRIEEQPLKLHEFLRRTPAARAFDLSYDYASYRPENARWVCVDLNTYDPADGSEAPCTFIGRGASEKEARMDLIEQFREFDNPEPAPKPRVSRVIHHSTATDPAEYSDEREVNFDSDLEDDDGR